MSRRDCQHTDTVIFYRFAADFVESASHIAAEKPRKAFTWAAHRPTGLQFNYRFSIRQLHGHGVNSNTVAVFAALPRSCRGNGIEIHGSTAVIGLELTAFPRYSIHDSTVGMGTAFAW